MSRIYHPTLKPPKKPDWVRLNQDTFGTTEPPEIQSRINGFIDEILARTTLGDNLEAVRRERKWSVEQICARIGIETDLWEPWTANTVVPDFNQVADFISKLRPSPGYVYPILGLWKQCFPSDFSLNEAETDRWESLSLEMISITTPIYDCPIERHRRTFGSLMRLLLIQQRMTEEQAAKVTGISLAEWEHCVDEHLIWSAAQTEQVITGLLLPPSQAQKLRQLQQHLAPIMRAYCELESAACGGEESDELQKKIARLLQAREAAEHSLSAFLRYTRLMRDHTVQDCSRRFEVDIATWEAWEAGTRTPNGKELERLLSRFVFTKSKREQLRQLWDAERKKPKLHQVGS